MKKSIYIFLGILLSACAATTTPAPSATPKAMDTVAPEASSTPTGAAVIVTAKPSIETAIPVKTIKINPILASENSIATKVAKFPVTCELVEDGDHSLSPSGNWLAAQCAPAETNNPKQNVDTLEIVNKQGKHWAIRTKDYDQNGVRATHCSHDEKYLYFETRPNVDTVGGFACFPDDLGAIGLYRLDLDNGTVSTVLPAGRALYNFSFSPTDHKLAYTNGDLTILDLQTSQETNVIVDATIGTLTWSSDSLELGYATCEENPAGYGVNNDYAPKESAIKVYSLKENASRTILEVKKRLLLIEIWSSTNILKINSQDEHYNSEYLFFDLNLSQWLTPTPTPQNP